MTLPEPLALAIFWVALAVSLLFSLFAAYDSWGEYLDVRWTHRRAQELFSNGRLRIARFRRVAGFWYAVGFNAMALVFGLVAYRAFTEPPEPDDALVLPALTRIFATLVVVSFWRTMRGQRRIRAELAEAADIKRDVRDVQGVVEDTNERVREMQERGISDRPEERTDRDEGRAHRTNIERDLSADREERAEERRLDREERAQERQDDREERRGDGGS